MDLSRLPPLEQRSLSIGYLRLTDAAPLVMAKELRLYEKYGLDVTLQREVSWANLRDRLITGDLDAAQMLAPLPLATSLGAGGLRAEILSGLALSLNGNAITVSTSLSSELRKRGAQPELSARSSATALRQYIEEEGAQLTFAAVHSFSCHTFLLRSWLVSAGIDPDRDVRVIVLPPEQMVDSLSRGIIDGYCVGEPWNSIAVQHGVGEVQATACQLWHKGIEKVLAVMAGWHQRHPATHLRLRLAVMEASLWLAHPDRRLACAKVLARPEYLDMPEQQLLPSLSGRFAFSRNRPPQHLPDFHVFGRYQAGFPWRSSGDWFLQQIGDLLGKSLDADTSQSIVQQSYRTDLYREAARMLQLPCPQRDYQTVRQQNAPWSPNNSGDWGTDLVPLHANVHRSGSRA